MQQLAKTQGYSFDRFHKHNNKALRLSPNQITTNMRRELVMCYYNILHYSVYPCARTIKECPILALPNSPIALKGYEKLKEELENGDDINYRLSNQRFNLNSTDGMFYAWGIRHFHLCNTEERKQHLSDDRFLAYAYLTNDTAYILWIGEHGEWGNCELAERLAWMNNDIIKHTPEIRGNVGLLSGKERVQLQKAGINLFTGINGSKYLPLGGGVMKDGKSQVACAIVMKTRRILRRAQDTIIDNYSALCAGLSSNNQNSAAPIFRIISVRSDEDELNFEVDLFVKNYNLNIRCKSDCIQIFRPNSSCDPS